jgi:hypothetical protein
MPYVDDTYRWVKDNYNGTKPVHHLALLVGMIVASSLLPNLFIPTGLKTHFVHANSPDEVRRIFDEMEWECKPKKGMVERSVFVTMFTTFIIALYEEDSPLRKHMDAAQRSGLGEKWTKKHGQLFKRFSTSRFSFYLFHVLAMKGVTYNVLIRLGILWGKGAGAYDRGIFKQSWGLHSRNHMVEVYNTLREKLGNQPYGPFDTLSLLIRDKNARTFCSKDRLNHVCRPPC